MKQLLLLFSLSLGCLLLSAQDKHADNLTQTQWKNLSVFKNDSLKSTSTDTLGQLVNKLDIAVQKTQHQIDSLQTLHLPVEKQKKKLDSLKQRIHHEKQAHQHRADSLRNRLNEPLSKISSTKDSLMQKGTESIASAQKKIDEKTAFLDSLHLQVKNPVTGESKAYGITKPDTNFQSQLNGKLERPGSNLNLPAVPDVKETIPDLNTQLEKPGIKGSTDWKDKIDNLQQLPQKQLDDTGVLDKVKDVKEKAQELGAVAKKAETYQEEIKNIREGGIEKAKVLPEELEKAAANVSEMKQLQAETKQFETAKNVLQQYQEAVKQLNEEKLAEQGKVAAQRQWVDHFSGNEEKIKAGVAQLDKLKRKYGNIPDSRYLPKHVPNPLKGKPLVERIVPSVNFQFFNQGSVANVDVSPFIAYRIYPRWRAAAGGMYRLQFNKKVQVVHDNPAYGVRLYSDYRVLAGFNVHIEGEWIKTISYNPYLQPFDPEKRKEWIPGLYAGLLKQYKISKRIEGNFQILYNVLYERNSLYPNKINMRCGFEFPLRKKIVKQNQIKAS